MVSNFSIIEDFLQFESSDDFYFVQIIQRRKENPDLKRNNKLIKTYYVDSLQKLEEIKPYIISSCQSNRARAYIHLNRRSFKKIAFHTMSIISDECMSEQFQAVRNAYNVACGKYSNEKNKTWLVDVDTKDWSLIDQITTIIENCQPLGEKKVKMTVPTKNGYHLITRPFDMKTFRLSYTEEIDIHKDNPTILYVPDFE